MRRLFHVMCCLLCLVVGLNQLVQAASDTVDKARRITGYLPPDKNTPHWDSLSEINRLYLGPVYTKACQWFLQPVVEPNEVGSLADFEILVYAMSRELKKRKPLKLGDGATKAQLEQWIRRLNTSIYGILSLEERKDSLYLNIDYTPESRILAAFRNEKVEGKLEQNELEVLETCSWWISENVQLGMPNGQKVLKVHDALIDTSAFEKKKHGVVEMVLQGRGSCVAYARATQLLLHMLKIDCRMVYGTEQMNHVWNMVELDEEWYHLDTCWDDPISASPMRTYNYFLLTDAEMESDHLWVNPDVYQETPQLNAWHHSVRNETRRACLASSSGYTLPREDECILPSLFNTYVNNAAGSSNTIANMLGMKLERSEKAEDALHIDQKRNLVKEALEKRYIAPDKRRKNQVDLAMRTSRYAPRPRRLSAQEKHLLVRNPDDFNKLLELYSTTLEGPRLEFRCVDDVEDWRMRLIVGASDIGKYAEQYNAIYDQKSNTISLDIKYWSHIRLARAYSNGAARAKLTTAEKLQLKDCEEWAASVKTQPNNRAKITLTHFNYPCKVSAEPKAHPDPLGDAVSAYIWYNSLGFSQKVAVVYHILGIPCELVHGRVKHWTESWLLVRINKRDWYHCDIYGDRGGKGILKCFELKSYCLVHDEDIRRDHAWDHTEVPRTPTKAEDEAKKKGRRVKAR